MSKAQNLPVELQLATSAHVKYIQSLGMREDVEAVQVAVQGNFYTACALAAVSVMFASIASTADRVLGLEVCRM